MSYTIQEVAKQMNISTYSIRYYHDHGMLPFVKRDENNNRIFEDTDLEWLHIIVCLRQTGMPVERIQHYLDLVQEGEQTVPERYDMMKAQQTRTLNEINDLQNHLKTINYKVDHYADILINHKADNFVPSNLAEAQQQDVYQENQP
ncbi:MerR family transcriptional regulator [Lactiplantibacillus mudanjiangensis]|uniref:MerR family transcriptional regulator [Lactobacillus sp.] n=1 Tax=Lactiplantibacillus mudanjiangensis TaxID=1296538 RepID=A0A660E0H1_9LACO|nr:MerR family transcriptional regulator [Lactiplantibacillus mudanjiangensis]VDG18937.1 MerR family transcriptional regulator [Lactobacillus sp.] [Lactiplantibacillus mudanjiangensis]VDG25286.1 MerR family transcriptional regulator [Lactobacillus sp.] [Lactiplantibacillus mudanjiangensis]VDG27461.1 MerR family transcriptional regulator [Lactobacillus sp.] [Lactiplantibacillus mudanjiangensis]VDG33038.1 MerR family transcriptional regulator [Lactobacillus sp.] [Lactiplantibacillus mudanjiangens